MGFNNKQSSVLERLTSNMLNVMVQKNAIPVCVFGFFKDDDRLLVVMHERFELDMAEVVVKQIYDDLKKRDCEVVLVK